MRFYIKYENTAFYGSPQYFLDDESFFYDPWNDTDFSIYIGDSYLGLDIILKSGEVKQLSVFFLANIGLKDRFRFRITDADRYM
ncbi:MAG TPA: hypothetical protein DCY31_08325 [Ruminococcaceae bacterium]|nr:hypothetical protein [Oscillospiraceae bacterium]